MTFARALMRRTERGKVYGAIAFGMYSPPALWSPRFPALINSEPAATAGISFRGRSRNTACAEATDGAQNNGRPNGPPEGVGGEEIDDQ